MGGRGAKQRESSSADAEVHGSVAGGWREECKGGRWKEMKERERGILVFF